jgi:hypothetical protein
MKQEFINYLRKSFLFILTIIIVGCSQSSQNNNGNSQTITTIQWQSDGNGFLQFKTNDSANYMKVFDYTIGSSLSTMHTVETQIKKISGSSNRGFGLNFCMQDNSNKYSVVIATSGSYSISKIISGTWYYYYSGAFHTTYDQSCWVTDSNINTSLGNLNTIKVTQPSSGTFNLYINGNSIITFTDGSFTGGYSGYTLQIGSQSDENFPTIYEDLRFNNINNN